MVDCIPIVVKVTSEVPTAPPKGPLCKSSMSSGSSDPIEYKKIAAPSEGKGAPREAPDQAGRDFQETKTSDRYGESSVEYSRSLRVCIASLFSS